MGTLLSITPVGTSPDSVTGTCSGTPAGGNFGQTNYVVSATATASSTVGDVALATGVTCRIWNDVTSGYWLSAAVSGSEPGPEAVAASEITVDTSNTNPIACVYTNALFTGNVTSANRTGGHCPSHP
jgi:hypothetical protein